MSSPTNDAHVKAARCARSVHVEVNRVSEECFYGELKAAHERQSSQKLVIGN